MTAEQATFSADGKHVYFLALNREKIDAPLFVMGVEIATGKSVPLAMPNSLGLHAELNSISRSKSGYLLLLYSDSLWAYDPIKLTASKVCAADAGNEFNNVTCDIETGRIYIDGKNGLLYLNKGESDPLMVHVRRVDSFGALTVLASNHLLFNFRGDAWLGRVDFESIVGGQLNATLEAHRFAPLATLETGNYTPAAHGVEEMAVSNKWVYVYMARMGGSAEGAVVRMMRPDLKTIDSFSAMGIQADAQAAAQELSSVETWAQALLAELRSVARPMARQYSFAVR